MKRFMPSGNDLNAGILAGISICLIPFLFSRATTEPVMALRFLALSLLLFLLAVRIWLQSKKPDCNLDFTVARRMIFPLFGGYFLLSAISSTQAVNLSEGVFELAKIFLAGVFLLLAAVIIGGSKNGVPILAKAAMLSTLALAIIGVCQHYRLAFTSIPGLDPPYATITNGNLFASFLLLSFAFIFYGILHLPVLWRIIGFAAVTLATLNIILVQSRAVWVAAVLATVTVIIFLATFFRKLNVAKSSLKTYLHHALQTAAILIIFVAGFLSKSEADFKETLAARIVSIAQDDSKRFNLWEKSLQMIRDHPVLGVGLGNWKIAIPEYGSNGLRSEFAKVRYTRPHNDYLWVWSEAGALALLCYLSFFGMGFYYILNFFFHAKDTHVKMLALCLLFGMICYMTDAFFSFPQERIEHTVYLMLIMATALAVYHKLFPLEKKSHRFATRLVMAPLLILLCLPIALGCLRLRSEIHADRAIAALAMGNWPTVIAEIDQAASPFATMDALTHPFVWYRGCANFALKRFQEAHEDFKKAQAIHPNLANVLNDLASSYAALGEYGRALVYCEKAIAISPYFEDGLINLGVMYYNTGRYAEAYRVLLRCSRNSKHPQIAAYTKAAISKLKAQAGVAQ
jgi:O-antigen ligase